MDSRQDENQTSSKEDDSEIVRAPLFQKYYATTVRGGLTDQDFRFEFINEQITDGKKWQYISDCLLIMSPRCAKTMSIILADALRLYEREHGAIRLPGPEEIRKKGYSVGPPSQAIEKKKK